MRSLLHHSATDASVSENFYDLIRVSDNDNAKHLQTLDKLKSLAILVRCGISITCLISHSTLAFNSLYINKDRDPTIIST